MGGHQISWISAPVLLVYDDERPPLAPDRALEPHNGLPWAVPYTYRGGDFSVDAEVITLPRPAPPRRALSPWIDPGWLDVPFSAPPEWLAELAMEDM